MSTYYNIHLDRGVREYRSVRLAGVSITTHHKHTLLSTPRCLIHHQHHFNKPDSDVFPGAKKGEQGRVNAPDAAFFLFVRTSQTRVLHTKLKVR